jgi:hypothetical protein
MGEWLMTISFTLTIGACTIAGLAIHHIWTTYTQTLEDLDDYRTENALLWEQNHDLKQRLGDTHQ